jgi:CBS domain-containing protein
MKVSEIMSQPAITVREDAALEKVAQTMINHKVGCVPVVDERGGMSGIITESDFAVKEKGIPFSTFRVPQLFGQWLGDAGVEQVYAAARTKTAAEIMSAPVITVTEGASIEEVLKLMLDYDVNRIPVVREKLPVGMVARYDLLKLMLRQQ